MCFEGEPWEGLRFGGGVVADNNPQMGDATTSNNYYEREVHNTTLVKQFCTIKISWKFEERCTAILFGTTLVMAVHAPDSSKSLEMYEACISSVVKVLREGQRGGAKDFYSTEDLNVDLGMMCTDETDIEELHEMCGPLCWQGYDKDPGGFKRLMTQLQGHVYVVSVR